MEELQKTATDLLEAKKVNVIIGYGQGSSKDRAAPVFIKRPEDVKNLIWNRRCLLNLTNYLTSPEVKSLGKAGIVVKGCDAKALCVLMQENQVKSGDIVIIGMACDGVSDPVLEKCQTCDVHTPPIYDFLIGRTEAGKPAKDRYEILKEIESKSIEERWDFWRQEFSKCIRCYACRAVCPMCYCTRCIAEKNQPQWIPASPEFKANFAWNVIRAFHLAGRCIGCGECERACPMDIPLTLLNRKLEKIVKESFNYTPGYSPEGSPPLTTFEKDDKEDFIR